MILPFALAQQILFYVYIMKIKAYSILLFVVAEVVLQLNLVVLSPL